MPARFEGYVAAAGGRRQSRWREVSVRTRAIVAAMAAVYAVELFGRFMPSGVWGERVVAAGLIGILTTVNYLGVRLGGPAR